VRPTTPSHGWGLPEPAALDHSAAPAETEKPDMFNRIVRARLGLNEGWDHRSSLRRHSGQRFTCAKGHAHQGLLDLFHLNCLADFRREEGFFEPSYLGVCGEAIGSNSEKLEREISGDCSPSGSFVCEHLSHFVRDESLNLKNTDGWPSAFEIITISAIGLTAPASCDCE